MPKMILRLTQNDGGQSAIETAVSLLVVLPMFMWVLQMCMFAYTITAFQYAARQGAQYAVTHGIDSVGCQGTGTSKATGSSCDATAAATEAVVIGMVRNATGQVLAHGASGGVSVSWTNGTNNPGDPVTVTVKSFMYKPIWKVPWMTGYYPQPYINAQATGTVLF
ncbi:MAG TPA: TadE family protein [Candidatus Binatia bacterium]|jgi:hypothetical protein|nr:TadE family protein [Candidatus Binatia bacterium]